MRFVLRALPALRAWMGGPLSWDQRAFDNRASHVYGGVSAPGIGAVGGLGDVREGCLVRAFVEESPGHIGVPACVCVRRLVLLTSV